MPARTSRPEINLTPACKVKYTECYLPSVFATKTGFPVPFLRKFAVASITAPGFGTPTPMVALTATFECDPPSRLYFPDRFEHTGFEVVFRPKVLAVGWRLLGN